MHFRNLIFLGALGVVLSFSQGPIAAQTQPPVNAKAKATTKTWTAPRTVDGQPDFQGVWANNNGTPLQRPKELADRTSLTDAEVAAVRKKAAELYDGKGDAEFGDTIFQTVWAAIQRGESGSHKKGPTGFDAGTGDYSSVWLAARVWDNRTALITDPPNGRMPETTPDAKRRRPSNAGEEGDRVRRLPAGPEDLSLGVRCITFGAPQIGAGYNSYVQIVQSAKTVSIETEMIHDARIIPLDGSPHLPPTVHQWLGDSRGHWEGDTLVIDTTNYRAGAFMGASDKVHVVERLTRTSPDVLQYQITIDDPATWVKPWTLMIPLRQAKEAIYEYACHEGNYGLAGILSGDRAEEQAAAKH